MKNRKNRTIKAMIHSPAELAMLSETKIEGRITYIDGELVEILSEMFVHTGATTAHRYEIISKEVISKDMEALRMKLSGKSRSTNVVAS